MLRDPELTDYLTRSGVEWTRLDELSAIEAERAWRQRYEAAFADRSRCKQGAKAEHAYGAAACDQYFVVPFSCDVAGLPVRVRARSLSAYRCRGSLVPLDEFHNSEFFVCPLDYTWTMVHTHEDHSFGGPYFIRADWLP